MGGQPRVAGFAATEPAPPPALARDAPRWTRGGAPLPPNPPHPRYSRRLLVTLDTLTANGNSATGYGGAFRILGETSGGNVGEATVTGGSYTTNTARDGGAFYVANAVLTVEGADLGSAATDNLPDDVSDCAGSWGTGASFVFDEDAGVYCE